MYLDVGKKCPKKALFYVPHLPAPITAKAIKTQFPEFASLMDGMSKENTLLFYWKHNKKEDVYEFLDTDCEEEVAELLGVKLYDGELPEEQEEERPENRQLTQEEVADFRNYLQEVREGMKEWEEKHSNDKFESDSE
jgi:hypothetical protein